LGSFAFALLGWLFGSLGHDAGHFSASRSPFLNDLGVLVGMSLLCNPIVWQHQHTFAHHSGTNDFHHDPDLHHFTTLLRVHRRFQQHFIYQYQSQYLYVLFAYLLVVFGTCFWIPIGMIRDGTLYGLVDWTDRDRNRSYYGLYLHWLVYAIGILVWPFLVHERWYHALLAVVVHVGTTGLVFALFSQINHLNEHSFPDDDVNDDDDDKTSIVDTSSSNTATTVTTGTATVGPATTTATAAPSPSTPLKQMLQQSWAARQVITSNNFCPQSRLWHTLSNGLNLQIEHHLFPGLNHCHLPLIQATVQNMCDQYDVPYKSYDSWSAIMTATLHWLNRLALEEPPTVGQKVVESR
jgi:fatty acid desaturase